jgi:hypothetical protein
VISVLPGQEGGVVSTEEAGDTYHTILALAWANGPPVPRLENTRASIMPPFEGRGGMVSMSHCDTAAHMSGSLGMLLLYLWKWIGPILQWFTPVHMNMCD